MTKGNAACGPSGPSAVYGPSGPSNVHMTRLGVVLRVHYRFYP